MGCWNETDGITQLPILAGDKVKVFILRGGGPGRREGGGTCYINDIWGPIGPPISGEYDDYGGVENIVQDKAAEITFAAIKENWPKEHISKENRSHEDIKSFDEMTLNDALYYIERDYVNLTGYQGNPEKLGLMFILEDVYQAIMEYNPIEADFSDKPYFYRPLRDIYTRDVTEFYTKAFKAFEEIKEVKKTKDETALDRIMFMRLDLGMESRLFHDYRDLAGKQFKSAIMKACENGVELSDPKAQELIKMTTDLFLLYASMTAARTQWSPQTGKGGQHSEDGVYRLITRAMTKVMDDREREMREENICEEPDKNGYYPYMLEQNAKPRESNDSNK